MGAYEDVILEFTDYPDNSHLVWIRNTNKNATVTANVTITGPKIIKLKRFAGLPDTELFGRQFEITIPPGAAVRVGQDTFFHAVSETDVPKPKLNYERVSVTFNITGAVYVRDEPQKPLPTGVGNDLGYYTVRSISLRGDWYFVVNLNCAWGISGSVQGSDPNFYFPFELSQFVSWRIWFWYDTEPRQSFTQVKWPVYSKDIPVPPKQVLEDGSPDRLLPMSSPLEE